MAYCLAFVLALTQYGLTKTARLPEQRVTVGDAERSVAAWEMKQRFSGTSSRYAVKLKEITPAEVWSRVRGQVFRAMDRADPPRYRGESYFLRRGEVVRLGTAFGGNGLISIVVADLDKDLRPELYFTYSWGSGIHRTQLGMLTVIGNKIRKSDANVAFRDGDMILKKTDDRTVKASVGKIYLGNIVLSKTPHGYLPDVSWSTTLPAGIKKLIWKWTPR